MGEFDLRDVSPKDAPIAADRSKLFKAWDKQRKLDWRSFYDTLHVGDLIVTVRVLPKNKSTPAKPNPASAAAAVEAREDSCHDYHRVQTLTQEVAFDLAEVKQLVRPGRGARAAGGTYGRVHVDGLKYRPCTVVAGGGGGGGGENDGLVECARAGGDWQCEGGLRCTNVDMDKFCVYLGKVNAEKVTPRTRRSSEPSPVTV